MTVEVICTDEFKDWYEALGERKQDRVYRSVELLRERGVTLPFPYSSAVNGASFALRGLRTQVEGDPLRTFYAFDPSRSAVLLLGGDKTGDDRFYERMIPFTEKIWSDYTSHGKALRFPGAGRPSGLPMPPNGSCLKFCPRVVYLEETGQRSTGR